MYEKDRKINISRTKGAFNSCGQCVSESCLLQDSFRQKAKLLVVLPPRPCGGLQERQIQTSTAQSLALAKRARYYQGLIDVDNLFSGADYKTLNETFVIFLCLGDAFGYGLPVYTFQNVCKEDETIKLNDGTQKIFFNAKMYDKMQSEELKAFFKYLCGKPSASDFTDKISAIVNRIKTSSEWRRDYMHFGVIMQDMIDEQVKILAEERAQELAEERANEKAVESAQRFLVMGILPEQVAEGTGLSLEQVKALQAKLKP